MISGRRGGSTRDHTHDQEQHNRHQGPVELAEHRLEHWNLQVTHAIVS